MNRKYFAAAVDIFFIVSIGFTICMMAYGIWDNYQNEKFLVSYHAFGTAQLSETIGQAIVKRRDFYIYKIDSLLHQKINCDSCKLIITAISKLP